MSLSIGIVGLPNVGKSSLFAALTNLQVLVQNYPFATINPNIGVVNVPDQRLYQLNDLIHAKKVTPAICQFVDIAGLVQGASKGEGLGNKFLANIRETSAICHVLRCFDNDQIIHVCNSVDPIRDMEIINLELIISDLEAVNKRIEKVHRKALSGDKTAVVYDNLYARLKKQLEANKFIKDLEFSDDEKEILRTENYLTNKPVIYLANISEKEVSCPQNNPWIAKIKQHISPGDIVLPLAISFEKELTDLSQEEKKEMYESVGIKTFAINQFILEAYKLLNLSTFFTFGEDEVKAWPFVNGSTAQECAGLIHSDIAKGFIRGEIMQYSDLIRLKTETAVKDAGLLRVEGKKYLMQDGDVCYFRFNV